MVGRSRRQEARLEGAPRKAAQFRYHDRMGDYWYRLQGCAWVVGVALGLWGCGTVRVASSLAGPTYAPTAAVRVTAFYVPGNASLIGAVTVEGSGPEEGKLERLLPEFIARVGQLGGNLAKVDRTWTHFRLVTSYMSCGPSGGTCTQTHEVATLHITGRALRVPAVAR